MIILWVSWYLRAADTSLIIFSGVLDDMKFFAGWQTCLEPDLWYGAGIGKFTEYFLQVTQSHGNCQNKTQRAFDGVDRQLQIVIQDTVYKKSVRSHQMYTKYFATSEEITYQGQVRKVPQPVIPTVFQSRCIHLAYETWEEVSHHRNSGILPASCLAL